MICFIFTNLFEDQLNFVLNSERLSQWFSPAMKQSNYLCHHRVMTKWKSPKVVFTFSYIGIKPTQYCYINPSCHWRLYIIEIAATSVNLVPIEATNKWYLGCPNVTPISINAKMSRRYNQPLWNIQWDNVRPYAYIHIVCTCLRLSTSCKFLLDKFELKSMGQPAANNHIFPTIVDIYKHDTLYI